MPPDIHPIPPDTKILGVYGTSVLLQILDIANDRYLIAKGVTHDLKGFFGGGKAQPNPLAFISKESAEKLGDLLGPFAD